jgi:hypothetical protein
MQDDELTTEQILEKLGLDDKEIAIIRDLKWYVTPILNFIPRTIPEYTDHGVRHSENILQLLVEFKQNLANTLPSFSFSKQELFLLALSACVHDIGCIIERPKHNLESARLLTKDPSFSNLPDKLGGDLLKCLELIVMAHSSNFTDLAAIRKGKINNKVNVRLMCAIFRLLDGCEISSARISSCLYAILIKNGLMKEEEEAKFWESHLNIIGLYFEGNRIVIDCEDTSKADLIISHLKDDLEKINEVFTDEGFPAFTVEVRDVGYD